MFYFTYKCRTCGKTFFNSGCSNETIIMKALIGAAQANPDDSGTHVHSIHMCKDDSNNMGIADLIGAKFTPDY